MNVLVLRLVATRIAISLLTLLIVSALVFVVTGSCRRRRRGDPRAKRDAKPEAVAGCARRSHPINRPTSAI